MTRTRWFTIEGEVTDNGKRILDMTLTDGVWTVVQKPTYEIGFDPAFGRDYSVIGFWFFNEPNRQSTE